ncbi:MAG: endonuclease/exonuclease/phosphatase family protein [Planctomycetes bacterium]|nr:endonuclease/exonuclease/phosphatase family protein [Planctomycetota bacterium]
MKNIFLLVIWCLPVIGLSQNPDSPPVLPPPKGKAIRIATFNAAMNRKESGELTRDLTTGDQQIVDIATIIQCVNPDVLLLNEVDYTESNAELLLKKFLQVPQPNGHVDISRHLKFAFSAPVNTGEPSAMDLNNNGRNGDPDDSWGYGAFPGQYGMVVLSRYPILSDQVRTFQKFRWSQMPNAQRPAKDGTFFHTDSIWEQLRLSSKSHWDVPVKIGDSTLHVLASHPTPPVFDGPEDRNGCRNHDEIRLWIDYISDRGNGDYLIDDQGKKGGLEDNYPFVILGDLNADPFDGDGKHSAIEKLLSSSRIAQGPAPTSKGGAEASEKSGQANARHRGDPSQDTGDFNDKNPGNLRIDYVLPSNHFRIVDSGIYWPSAKESERGNQLARASDHRLVWVDAELQ